MTARDRLRREPAHVLRRLEDTVAREEAAMIADPRPALWPWILLALAAGIAAGATLVPHAEPLAVAIGGGE